MGPRLARQVLGPAPLVPRHMDASEKGPLAPLVQGSWLEAGQTSDQDSETLYFNAFPSALSHASICVHGGLPALSTSSLAGWVLWRQSSRPEANNTG